MAAWDRALVFNSGHQRFEPLPRGDLLIPKSFLGTGAPSSPRKAKENMGWVSFLRLLILSELGALGGKNGFYEFL
jgi:hypothetical protein